MKIAFFGTSDRSVPVLESLRNNFDLELCITKADTVVGRKQVIRETAVKEWAKDNGVEFVEISDIKTDQLKIVDKLKEYEIDLGIVADFSFIIPEKIINTPKFGLINLHFSLLPKLRGTSPVQHTILQGFDKTGVTYFLIDKGMDTGDVLKQVEYKLQGKETSGELYKKLFELAANHLPDVINQYTSGKIKPVTQDHKQATLCRSKTNPKLTTIQKADARINWQKSTTDIERQIRAYNPWPIAWTTLGELEKNDKLSEKIALKPHVRKDLKVKIYQADMVSGKLQIQALQVEGKKIVDWKSFKNGYTLV